MLLIYTIAISCSLIAASPFLLAQREQFRRVRAARSARKIKHPCDDLI